METVWLEKSAPAQNMAKDLLIIDMKDEGLSARNQIEQGLQGLRYPGN